MSLRDEINKILTEWDGRPETKDREIPVLRAFLADRIDRLVRTQIEQQPTKERKLLEDLMGEGGQGEITIRDLCFTSWSIAKGTNKEDGGPTDWFTDTLPTVLKGIERFRDRLTKI